MRLKVRISKPISEVFEFTTNPENTPKWIDSIVKKTRDSDHVEIGTIYQNWSGEGEMNEYKVTQYEPLKVFQLDATHQDYTYTQLSENETELEYYEWSESDELHSPFMQEILDKLKAVMEQQT